MDNHTDRTRFYAEQSHERERIAAIETEQADADEFCRSRLERVLGEIRDMGKHLPDERWLGKQRPRYHGLIQQVLDVIHDELSAEAAAQTRAALGVE